MKIMDNIEIGLCKVEEKLTQATAIPVLGTVPAAVKVALGAIQAVAATICLAACIPPALARDITWINRPVEHIAHGVLNMISGAVESIPLIGTCMYLTKRTLKKNLLGKPLYASSGNNFNMPYNSLVTPTIGGTDARLVQKAQTRFGEKTAGKELTNFGRYLIAQKIVRKILSKEGNRPDVDFVAPEVAPRLSEAA